jgi:hypothetical protein
LLRRERGGRAAWQRRPWRCPRAARPPPR